MYSGGAMYASHPCGSTPLQPRHWSWSFSGHESDAVDYNYWTDSQQHQANGSEALLAGSRACCWLTPGQEDCKGPSEQCKAPSEQDELLPWATPLPHTLSLITPPTAVATPASPFSPLQLHSQPSTARSALQDLIGSAASCNSDSGSVSGSSWLLPQWPDMQGSSPEHSPRLGSSPEGIDWCSVLARAAAAGSMSQQQSNPSTAAGALPSSGTAARGSTGCPTTLLSGTSAQAQALALELLLLLAASGPNQNHGIASTADMACPVSAARPSAVPPLLQPPHPLLPLSCSSSGMQAAQQACMHAGMRDMLEMQQLLAACQMLQQGVNQGTRQQQQCTSTWPDGQPCSDPQQPCQQKQLQTGYDPCRSSTSGTSGTGPTSQAAATTPDLGVPRRFSRRSLPPLPCPPSRKLFVGHLHPDVDEEVLGSLFASCGEVLCAKVLYNSKSMSRPRRCWRSREFGFVDFSSQAQADQALSTFSGLHLPGICKGRLPLLVQYVRDSDAGACTADWPSVHWCGAGV